MYPKLLPFSLGKSVQRGYNPKPRYVSIPKNTQSISALLESLCEERGIGVADSMNLTGGAGHTKKGRQSPRSVGSVFAN
jgi:hypothetical protein